MKKLKRRLAAKRGETLVETLAAILIFTLSSVILLTMTATAMRVNTENKEVAARNEEQMLYAEQGPDSGGSPESMEVSIQLITGSGSTVNLSGNVDVDVYRQDEDALYAYFKSES